MSAPVYCTAPINHAGADGAAVPVPVEIHDGRCADLALDYRSNGFELQEFTSSVQDWTSLAAVEAVHYDEVTAWARAFTGCDAVLFYPALLRNPLAQAASADFAPIEAAHSDYTEAYDLMIRDPQHPYHRVLAPSMRRAAISDERLASARRILTLQLWRNVGPSLPDFPLAVCDARTVPRTQLAPVRVESYGGLDTQFDAFALLPPETVNCWYTFPAMRAEEVIVFRAFDSDCVTAGKPFWTPHCAFRDPHSDGGARHSVEMRAVCLFW